ncbi:MAG: HAD hydrolase family protein [Christensenellales bacterium]
MPALRAKLEGPLSIILSGEHWVDVMKPGVNKGCAMRGIQQKLGISAAECMAFGDYLNDCELLQAVGESYAMETRIRRSRRWRVTSPRATTKTA